MWDYVSDRESDPSWVKDALTTGIAIFSTDRSFRPKADALVSGAGWVITCTKTRRTLEGSFYKRASLASSYQGELIGLVAIHTFILAAATYHNLLQLTGTICCGSQSALDKSRRKARRVQASTKQADLFRSLRRIHSKMPTPVITYVWVKAHVNRTTVWSRLSLLQQLNMTCDQLANSAVTRALSRAGNEKPTIWLLPSESVAIIADGVKITSDVSSNVRYQLGHEEACKFYTKAIRTMNGVNKGGLGWHTATFDLVDWKAIGEALKGKPEMLGLWLAKQTIGVCATRKNLARIQDILDDHCPNCGSPREDNKHLNRCPDEGRRRKFRGDVKDLQKWLSKNNQTDPELAFWIPYYLLLRGQTPMAELSNTTRHLHSPSTMMTATTRKAAASQDSIGWTEFLHGKV